MKFVSSSEIMKPIDDLKERTYKSRSNHLFINMDQLSLLLRQLVDSLFLQVQHSFKSPLHFSLDLTTLLELMFSKQHFDSSFKFFSL